MAAQSKQDERTYYRVYHYTDKHEAGVLFDVNLKIEFDSYCVDKSDLAELSKLSLKELQSKRTISVGEEKAAFQAVQAAGDQWTVCAAQTMLLDRAIEYVQTPEVPHTANEWKPIKDGQMEISNLVYVMRYKISQQKDGNHKGQWLVTWGIALNRPPRPKTEKYYYAGDVMVVDVKKKYYNGEADAQHYIQGRFDVYAHLFTELSPPVPDKYKRHFQINGVLLPGYTIAPPERAPHEVADELLSLLDDNDLVAQPGEEQEPPTQEAPASKLDTKAVSPSKPAPEKRLSPKAAKKPQRPAAKKKAAAKRPSGPAR